MRSAGRVFIMPMQDVLALGSSARMNRPGKRAGNWNWRLPLDALDHHGKDALLHITRLSNDTRIIQPQRLISRRETC